MLTPLEAAKSASGTTSGGETGIRTLDRVSPIHAFQACAFNHSAISPVQELRVIARTLRISRGVPFLGVANSGSSQAGPPSASAVPVADARAAAGRSSG